MTAKSIKHKFASTVTDGPDASVVRPSNWNDDHNFFLGVNAQTGTSYTFVDADVLSLVTFANAAAIAVSLPQAGAGSAFLLGWLCFVRNIGPGVVTITPTTSTINAQITLVLGQGQAALIISDGTNYKAIVVGIGPEVTIASATTTDLGSVDNGLVAISGTTTITSLGTAPDLLRFVRFTGALTLTHNATSLILPGGASIKTAAGDTADFMSDASGNWRCIAYQRVTSDPVGSGEASVASSGTTDIGAVDSQRVQITGTTTITSFGSRANVIRQVRFGGVLTLTNNNTSLILPGALNITTAVGDTAIFASDGSGNWRCISYQPANGHPLTTAAATIASSGTTDLGSVLAKSITISGTTTITSLGTSAPTGTEKNVEFSGALTLTQNAASLILPGALNITTAAGDTAIFRHEGSGNWRCLAYQRASGAPLITDQQTIASASTTDLGSVLAQNITVSGTTTITSFGSTAPTGATKNVYFSGALTLTQNATSLILPGAANITTVAGNTGVFRHEGSGNWRCIAFTFTADQLATFIKTGAAATGVMRSKVITITRDLTTASGNISYTGVGFKPSALIAVGGAAVSQTTYTTFTGFADSGATGGSLFEASQPSPTAHLMLFSDGSLANYQTADVVSFDSDGFTLSWTKNASPTNSITAYVLCLR